MTPSNSPADTLKRAAGASIGWAVVMIVLGVLALCLPLAAGLGVSIALGWIVVFCGVAHVASALVARGAGAFLWRTLVGIVYIFGGAYLALHPALALASLTLALAVIFLLEGVLEIFGFFQFRLLPGSGWALVNGLVTLLLAVLIWRQWPTSSAWAIGTLVGIKLMMSGFSRLMYSVAARNVVLAVS